MTQINAYVGFDGKAREAMTFYKEILGGELDFQLIGGSPVEAFCGPGKEDQILHSTLIKDGNLLLMGSDMVDPGGFVHGNSMSLSINCFSEEEITDYYNKFSEGGKILDDLKVQFWGAMFAVVEDKFGVRWMFNYDKQLAV